jgi:hypothetical protein
MLSFTLPHQTMSEGSAKDERTIKACAARTERSFSGFDPMKDNNSKFITQNSKLFCIFAPNINPYNHTSETLIFKTN